MMTGAARVSVMGNFEVRRKNPSLRFIVGLLYGAEMRLVTTPSEEELLAPRRSQARLGAVLHARDEDEDDRLPQIFDEGVWWATVWAGMQAAAGLLWWAAAWAVRPGKPVSSFSFISVFLFSVFHIVNLNIVLNSIFSKLHCLNSSEIHSRHLKFCYCIL
jgi:hypothetical protein